MPSSFFTKQLLHQLYFREKKSTYDIAAEYECDPKTVYYWLLKYGIPTRPRKVVTIPKNDLKKYYDKGLSLKTIGVNFGINASAVYRKMRQFRLPRRRPWQANIKHERKNFSKNKTEKSYLIGFRIGDLYVKQNASSIIVKSNTTHPVQIELMKKLFSQYGPCWISSPKSRKKVFHCTIMLNKSFHFLVEKPSIIPHWILQSNQYFLAFLAGYTDAEGTIRIYAKRAGLRIGSYDKNILKQIHQRLTMLNVKNTFRLETKKGYNRQNGDFYRVSIMNRYALYRCLLIMIPYLKHKFRLRDSFAAFANVTNRM